MGQVWRNSITSSIPASVLSPIPASTPAPPLQVEHDVAADDRRRGSSRQRSSGALDAREDESQKFVGHRDAVAEGNDVIVVGIDLGVRLESLEETVGGVSLDRRKGAHTRIGIST